MEMYRASAVCALALGVLSACGGSSGGVVPASPPSLSGSGGGVTPTPAPVSISEIAVPQTPEYVAADKGGAYFGYGSSGTGSNLFYYDGTFAQTAPAEYDGTGGAGVYGIFEQQGTTYWLSAYFGSDLLPQIAVECGSKNPTICAPLVDEPTAVLVDTHKAIWVAGMTYQGGGEIRTTAQQSFDSATQGVIALALSPGGTVWGILRQQNGSVTADTLVSFAVSGSTISIARQYPLPANTIAGGLTFGGDGNPWFSDPGTSSVGTVDASGTLHEYATPHPLTEPDYGQSQIVADCDGDLWVTESASGMVARMTTQGAVKEYTFPTPSGFPQAIASAGGTPCERKLWVGEARSSKIAEITY